MSLSPNSQQRFRGSAFLQKICTAFRGVFCSGISKINPAWGLTSLGSPRCLWSSLAIISALICATFKCLINKSIWLAILISARWRLFRSSRGAAEIGFCASPESLRCCVQTHEKHAILFELESLYARGTLMLHKDFGERTKHRTLYWREFMCTFYFFIL